MKKCTATWDTILVVSMVLVAGACAETQPLVRAADAELEGPIVRIAPDEDGKQAAPLATEPQIRVVEEDVYWIGMRGRRVTSAVLRTHLQLAEDMGVVVEEVVPNSPAEKAGLRQHDIILRAGGEAVHDMATLQQLVRAGKDQPLELKIIRLGQPEKVVVVPELRPQQLDLPAASGPVGPWGDAMPRELLDRLLQGRGQRLWGPGMLGGGRGLDQLPPGMSISIERRQDGPPQVTVKKGEQTWSVQGDDEQALQQLPADVQPFVERLLSSPGHPPAHFPWDWQAELQRALPERGEDRNSNPEDPWAGRIQELERKLQNLQQRLENEAALP